MHHSPPLPGYHSLEEWLKKLNDETGFEIESVPLLIACLAVLFFCFVIAPAVVGSALAIALFLSPLWLPYLLTGAAFREWIILRRSQFIAAQEMVLLELVPPRSVEKTPLAMEAVLSGIHLSPGESNWYAVNILGKVRPWWSLEIVSTEGKVHFYMQTRTAFRRQVEAQVYAQYPGAQVVEVADYTRQLSAKPGEWEIWGCDFEKSNKVDAYPIKTYVEYGLDKVQKEPEQTDPLANLVEFMGSLGPGEHMWIQMIVRVAKGEKFNKLNAAGKAYTWKDQALEEIENIRTKTVRKNKIMNPVTGKLEEVDGFPNPTKGQSESIAALERNVSKLAFDTGIRGVYLARPENFSGTTIPSMVGIFKQFNAENHNSFKPARWMTIFNDYPWEMNVKHRKDEVRHAIVDAYRRRLWFYPPFETPWFTMSTEELATIYHIPSGAISTPTLPRIQSQTSEAPAGLPT